MKKLIAIVLTLVMVACMFAGCAGNAGSDLAYIQNKGKLIVGITEYPPMDYKDENGEWIGFDADLAKAVAAKLGVEVEFYVIADWGKKFIELEDKQIDVVWNGMTISDTVKNNCSCSIPYVYNAQVIVVPDDKLDAYADVEAMKDAKFTVENGSAGADAAAAAGFTNVVALQYQTNALMEVAAGTSDACIIDYTMAKNMTADGAAYDNLNIVFTLTEEEYGIGFRKGSDVTEKVNAILKELAADGTMQALADKYGVSLAEGL